jgi:hypothetical protein
MHGVSREPVEHTLHNDPSKRPIEQSLQSFNYERCRATNEEVNQLLDARFIRGVKHPKWLAYPLLVPKKNNTWRVCIDHT